MQHTRDRLVLALVCAAQFMVVLDLLIVNVALPSIRADLGFSVAGLLWVVNAYTVTFAGFMLLGGRAADLYGQRRVFLLGLALFTGASLVGGFAQDQAMLVGARVAQGLGAAVLSPATLTILVTTFPEGSRRAKALGIWSALSSAGGAAGVLLGGVLTDLVSWRWILFVNVPIGILGVFAARQLLAENRDDRRRNLDLLGAVVVTVGLMTLVYGIVNTGTHAWTSIQTLATLGAAVGLAAWFLTHEVRVAKNPLMPLGLFRLRTVTGANLVILCLAGASFASWYFLSLYMQNVLGYSPLKAGIGFLPLFVANIAGTQVAAPLVTRVGPRALLIVGALVSAAGLAWLANLQPHGTYWTTLFGSSVLMNFGIGLSIPPITFAATARVPAGQAGLSSGLINTTRQVGDAIGLAVLVTVATDRTTFLLRSSHQAAATVIARPGRMMPLALAQATTSGYGRAFIVCAFIALAAAFFALSIPRLRPRRTADMSSGQVPCDQRARKPGRR